MWTRRRYATTAFGCGGLNHYLVDGQKVVQTLASFHHCGLGVVFNGGGLMKDEDSKIQVKVGDGSIGVLLQD